MDSERWQRIEQLFEQAERLPAAERRAFLRRACGPEEELLRDVERMLEPGPDALLEPPSKRELGEALGSGSAGLAADGDDDLTGLQLGPWRIEERLGLGGMGAVYLARRVDEQFEKRAAVKLIKRGMDTDDILRRFRTERQVLADLEHPGIARLIDGGATGDGRPYLVMEYVDGVRIDHWVRRAERSLSERLDLFLRICDAVQYAHGKRVVHRDLKPSNILISADGDPKLLDFGIAKVLDATGSARTVDATVTELRLMTPEYAAPEQMLGGPVTPATDVYGLGVILYELLTGRRPYFFDSQLRVEMERVICQEDPVRPSTAVRRTGTDSAARSLSARLAGDLDKIVMKALHKEPERRYASAGPLADDLRRHLAGQPVHAQPDTWGYRCSKFVRRNRSVVAATASVVAVLVVALIFSTTLYLRAERERAAGRYREYIAQIAAAAGALESRDSATARSHLEQAPVEHRGWEWRHLAARADRSLVTLQGAERRVLSVEFSPDGRQLATAGNDEWMFLWDLPDGTQRARWEHGSRDRGAGIRTLAFTRDGTALVSVSQGDARLWDARTQTVLRKWSSDRGHRPVCVAFDLGLGLLVTGGTRGRIRVWDPQADRALHEFGAHSDEVREIALVPDGTRVVSCSYDGSVQVRRLPGGELVLRSQLEGRIHCMALDPAGERAAVGLFSGSVVVLELEQGREVLRLDAHSTVVECAAWSPDGTRLATGSRDRSVRVWEGRTGELLALLLGHEAPVHDVAFHPSGNPLASSCTDGTIKLWNLDSDDLHRIDDTLGSYVALALSPDGERLVSVGGLQDRDDFSHHHGSGFALWDLVGPTRVLEWPDPAPEPDDSRFDGQAATFDAAGERFAVTTGTGVLVWDALEARELLVLEDLGPVRGLAFLADGTLLTAGPHSLRVWDLERGELLRSSASLEPTIVAASVSPDRSRFATCQAQSATVWDAGTLEPVLELIGHEDDVRCAVWHPDGSSIATGSYDQTVRLWDPTSGRELGRLSGHSGEVMCLAFSPDGERLVSGSWDRTLRVWDPRRLQEVCTLRGHSSRVGAVVFAPDGSRVLSKARFGEILTWDSLPATSGSK